MQILTHQKAPKRGEENWHFFSNGKGRGQRHCEGLKRLKFCWRYGREVMCGRTDPGGWTGELEKTEGLKSWRQVMLHFHQENVLASRYGEGVGCGDYRRLKGKPKGSIWKLKNSCPKCQQLLLLYHFSPCANKMLDWRVLGQWEKEIYLNISVSSNILLYLYLTWWQAMSQIFEHINKNLFWLTLIKACCLQEPGLSVSQTHPSPDPLLDSPGQFPSHHKPLSEQQPK